MYIMIALKKTLQEYTSTLDMLLLTEIDWTALISIENKSH